MLKGHDRKNATAIEVTYAIICVWIRPVDEEPPECCFGKYIILLFTRGSSAPSFLAPNTFWLLKRPQKIYA